VVNSCTVLVTRPYLSCTREIRTLVLDQKRTTGIKGWYHDEISYIQDARTERLLVQWLELLSGKNFGQEVGYIH
jgi:hypothetical protein